MFGLVDWTLVDVTRVLLVHGYGTDEDDGHVRREFLETGIGDHARLGVPPGALHEETVDVGSLSGRAVDVLLVLLGDVTLQAHLVQGPFVLTRHGLHDGRQEALRVEEATQPDSAG